MYPCPTEHAVGYHHLQENMQHSLRLRERYAQAQATLTKETIQPLYRQFFPDCPLVTIPGIGRQSAATYRAFIQDINRSATVETFRLWCGIVPHSKQKRMKNLSKPACLSDRDTFHSKETHSLFRLLFGAKMNAGLSLDLHCFLLFDC